MAKNENWQAHEPGHVLPRNGAPLSGNYRDSFMLIHGKDRPKQPKRDNGDAMPWYMNWDGCWKRVIEVMGVLGLFAYCVLTYFQWSDLRHNFVTDERPWLEVKLQMSDSEFDELTVDKLPDQSIPMCATNVGKTPTLHYIINTTTEVLSASTPAAPKEEVDKDHVRSGSRHTGNVLFSNECTKFSGGSTEKLTGGQRRDLALGNSYIIWYGIASYDDVLGVSHWTRFCFWKAFTKEEKYSAKPCVLYNAVDFIR